MGQSFPLSGTIVRGISRASIRSPRLVLSLWCLIVALLMAGGLRLEVDSSTSSFLDTGSPEWSVYQRSLASHGGDEFIAVVLAGSGTYGPDELERVRKLQLELERVAGVRRVDSLASVPLIRSGKDGEILLSGAVEDGVPENPREFAGLAAMIRADRIAPGALISRDERVLALNVVLDDDVSGDRTDTVAEIRKASGSAWVTGVPVFRTEINKDTLVETATLVPLTCALMAVLFGLSFRSRVGVALPLGIGALASGSSLGVMGWLGTALSLSTMILPSILVALGCAYSMHILAAASRGPARELETHVLEVAVPVALSGLTTALGFLAISTTRITAIRELSLFGAFGVLVLTAASLSAAPAAVALSGEVRRRRAVNRSVEALCQFLARLIMGHSRSVKLFWAAVFAVSLVGLSRVTISSNIIEWYSESAPVRAEYTLTREALSGISPVNILVESQSENVATDPEVLRAVYQLGNYLEKRADVGKVLSLADPLLMMRRAMTGDEDVLPETQDEIQQYLLILDSEDQIRDLVSADQRSLSLMVRVNDNGSKAIAAVADAAEEWWDESGPRGFSATATGIMYEFAREQDAIARTQLSSLSLALFGMGAVLWSVLGSFRNAVLCLVPNLLPIAVAYGGMGYLGLPIDAATACLGSLALGVAVDDTVHVALSIDSVSAKGLGGLRDALRRVLFPVAVSSVAIAIGFGALAVSEFVLIRNLGALTAVIVVVCWLADLTLLPCLLLGRRS